jgi:hypothetical protein
LIQKTYEDAVANRYFEKISGQFLTLFGLSMTSAIVSPMIAWLVLLIAIPLLAYSKGDDYRRVVKSYFYPNQNLKILKIALTKLLPFTVSLVFLAMAAMELMTISTEHGLVFS